MSFFTGIVRRRIEGCYRDVSLAVNLSHDQENRDYPSQPQQCGPWIIIGNTELKEPATMCPFCFATVALASAGAATSGGLTILAVRKFYGRDRSAKNRINPGRCRERRGRGQFLALSWDQSETSSLGVGRPPGFVL